MSEKMTNRGKTGEHIDEIAMIPFFAHEGEIMRMERQLKRMMALTIISVLGTVAVVVVHILSLMA